MYSRGLNTEHWNTKHRGIPNILKLGFPMVPDCWQHSILLQFNPHSKTLEYFVYKFLLPIFSYMCYAACSRCLPMDSFSWSDLPNQLWRHPIILDRRTHQVGWSGMQTYTKAGPFDTQNILIWHFSVLLFEICFVYLNLPIVLLMFFNKLASCSVPNINLLLFCLTAWNEGNGCVGNLGWWSVVIYSTVRNGHNKKWKQANGDYLGVAIWYIKKEKKAISINQFWKLIWPIDNH